MKALTEKILHYLALVFVTLFAVWVMWKMTAREAENHLQVKNPVRPLPPVSAPKAPVAIESLQLEMCEITSKYAGKIQPWETYQIGCEVPGRVASLGSNQAGNPLDEGDRVEAGQVLALLDDRVYRARKSEAAARVEQATADLRRGQQVRDSNPSALSESELQALVTDLALARAQLEVATKNLDDATLKSPVNATVSKRMVKAGESVGAHQIVFALVENDDVLLVVDVPESQIRELEHRMREVEFNQQASGEQLEQEDLEFRAHVYLEGRDRFGNALPPLDGTVYRIAEVADPRTGLFPLEIRLSNESRMLRPGMVATADVIVARVQGYEVPESSVIFRHRSAHLFTVVTEPARMEVLYWDVGPTQLHRARKVELTQWIDQGEYVVVPADVADLDSVVVRGHLRLADTQLVRVVRPEETSPGEPPHRTPVLEKVDVASGL